VNSDVKCANFMQKHVIVSLATKVYHGK